MRLLSALLIAALVAGCDGFTDDGFAPELVVSASVGAGEPLPAVYLSETSPLLEAYDPEAVAVRGAEVALALLAADGSAEATYAYRAGDAPGQYVPADEGALGLPERTYRLSVSAGDRRLTATATVPPALEVVAPPAPSVVFGTGQGPELVVTRTSTDTRRTAFIASTRALAPHAFVEVPGEDGGDPRFRSVPTGSTFGLTPTYARFLDCAPAEDDPAAVVCGGDPRENALSGSSPVINEDGYVDRGDGTVLVQVPYLAFGFYGPVRITLTSVDAALEAFVESQAIQGGGSTLSPGEIPNVTTNVEGGRGVFGAYAQVTAETMLTPAF